MLFNSVEFAIFLPLVFVLYWFVTNKSTSRQNILLLVASYFFYGWWDWRFLSLIAFSTLVDFVVGIQLSKTDDQKKRKFLLLVSILVNIGFLAYFKYFNFFINSFSQAFTLLGKSIPHNRLNIILPVGISFYTFQTLSYSIDVYRGKIEPTKKLIDFAAFVSFFPQLVAGPIERASNLLPQFGKQRIFDQAKAADGLRQILWGLFKKIVIADNCATLVNDIFANSAQYSGSTLLLGAVLFAFQIYGDFSGYSDIAIGTARLFGFNLMQNFALPYFSRDIAEFWRRWHISLSTWFRDYVYIPLGGSRGTSWQKIRNVFVIFLVSGFWHGANWTFLAWGFINALFFIPLLLGKQNRKNIDQVAANTVFPSFKELLQIIVTFFLTTIAWVFFRAESIKDAFIYLKGIFSKSLFNRLDIFPTEILLFIAILIIIEWIQRKKQHGLEIQVKYRYPRPVRWSFYSLIILVIFLFGDFESGYEFIYFQF